MKCHVSDISKIIDFEFQSATETGNPSKYNQNVGGISPQTQQVSFESISILVNIYKN